MLAHLIMTKLDTVSPYSDKQKLEAVTTYLTLGSVELTAAVLKISVRTLFYWKRTEWWNELVNEIKKEDRLVISAKLRKILDKSWHLVEDRLENGDFVLNNKTGEIIRRPVALKDAAKVAFDSASLFDKLDRQDHFVVATEQIEDKLKKLAQSFADLASGKKPKSDEIVDIESKEIENALPEEREAQLQPGV